jgi:glycine betaine transporter
VKDWAVILVAVSCLLVLGFPVPVTQAIATATGFAMSWLDSPILWMSSSMLLVCLLLVAGPWGSWRLGGSAATPEFSTFAWLAMLFAAGMGSGLVFWGVAEPLTHRLNPAPGWGDPAANEVAMAMATTYFHWGLHAWAIYAVAGLVIAWFSYRRQAPEAPSGALLCGLRGLIPDPLLQGLALLADFLAIVAVVFGVAAALANGTILLHEGISRAVGLTLPQWVAYGLILLSMGLLFLASAGSGLRRGIRWLSMANVWLALLMLAVVLVFASRSAVFEAFWQGGWQYLKHLPEWSWQLAGSITERGWAHGWTVTYLLWWIAWAPFVGVFIARISRGRTIRGFVAGVVLVPVLFSMAWFSVMGGGALDFDAQHQGQLSGLVKADYTAPLFAWFAGLPAEWAGWGRALTYASCLLLFVFLVTSADSAAYVLGMLGSGGNPNPTLRRTLLWGTLTVGLAAGLLARDSADVNKAVAIFGAIPYAFLLLLQILALLRGLWREWLGREPG